MQVQTSKEPTLAWFDLGKLVSEINEALAEEEGIIERGVYIPKRPKRRVNDWFSNKEAITSGRYPITQTVRGTFGLLGLHSEINVGYIHVETGVIGANSRNGEVYEAIELRINRHQLGLKYEGRSIPNSRVELSLVAGEFDTSPTKRNDYQKFCRAVWLTADLISILPTEWFLSGRES